MNQKPVAIITGTSRGLGKSIAENFLEKGYKVYGCSRGQGSIQNELYTHEELNVSDEARVRSWIKNVKKESGSIDVLVCNASLVQSTLYLSLTPTSLFDDFISSNINGVFFLLREVSKQMLKQKNGNIITISSTMVPSMEKGTSIYSSTKAFVEQMTKVLAKELIEQNVRCNIVAPAYMKTSSSEELSQDPNWVERVLEIQDIKRPIEHEEVTSAINFLVSPQASAMTGQALYLGVIP